MNSYFEYLEGKSRDELALDLVFSFMALHRRTVITRVECERQENNYRILVHHKNTITDRSAYISFSFYRNAEEKEADRFINTVCAFCGAQRPLMRLTSAAMRNITAA